MRDTTTAPTDVPDRHRDRWRLLGDLLSFQGKLVVDGLKDLVLSPVSLIAVVIGMLTVPHDPGRYFYRMMRIGRNFDRWVDLFGADKTKKLTGPSAEAKWAGDRSGTLDALIDRFERAVVAQHEQGGLTEKARQAIDRALDSLEPKPKGTRDDP